MKKQSMIMWIIIIALAIFFIGPKLGLFTINLLNIDEIKSDFIGKAGTTSAIRDCNIFGSCDMINFLNELFDKGYIYGVFDSPLELSDSFKGNTVNSMQNLNSYMNIELTQLGFSPGVPVFSSELISALQKDEYTQEDLNTIANELGKAPKRWCTSVTIIRSNEFTNSQLIRDLFTYCNNLPENIFEKSGSEWRLKTLPDFTIREGNKSQTLRLSNIETKLIIKNGDIFIAAGHKAVSDIEKISPKYEFAQYAYEVDHESCGTDEESMQNGGCMVISNSQDVIDASTGKIKESGTISDLWYGLTKKGEGFTNPIFLIAGGIILLFIIIIIIKK